MYINTASEQIHLLRPVVLILISFHHLHVHLPINITETEDSGKKIVEN